jgi:hypothetical protein
MVALKQIGALDRPCVQWIVVLGSATLTALLAVSSVMQWRAGVQVDRLEALVLESRAGREAIERELMRERSARQALSLELKRLRERDRDGLAYATLTMSPLTNRGPLPAGSMTNEADRRQTIELRLVLPKGQGGSSGQLQITARDWSTGQVYWSRARTTTAVVEGRRAVIAYVTGEMLPAGAYELLLTSPQPGASVSPQIAAYELVVQKGQEP